MNWKDLTVCSRIPELLENVGEDTLTSLLDEKDIIQEFRSCNPNLLNFFLLDASVSHLISLLIPSLHQECLDDGSKNHGECANSFSSKDRYACAVSELFSCQNRDLNEKILTGKHIFKLLQFVRDFIHFKEHSYFDSILNFLVCSFKVILSLVATHPDEMLAVIMTDEFLQSLVSAISFAPVSDFIFRLTTEALDKSYQSLYNQCLSEKHFLSSIVDVMLIRTHQDDTDQDLSAFLLIQDLLNCNKDLLECFLQDVFILSDSNIQSSYSLDPLFSSFYSSEVVVALLSILPNSNTDASKSRNFRKIGFAENILTSLLNINVKSVGQEEAPTLNKTFDVCSEADAREFTEFQSSQPPQAEMGGSDTLQECGEYPKNKLLLLTLRNCKRKIMSSLTTQQAEGVCARVKSSVEDDSRSLTKRSSSGVHSVTLLCELVKHCHDANENTRCLLASLTPLSVLFDAFFFFTSNNFIHHALCSLFSHVVEEIVFHKQQGLSLEADYENEYDEQVSRCPEHRIMSCLLFEYVITKRICEAWKSQQTSVASFRIKSPIFGHLTFMANLLSDANALLPFSHIAKVSSGGGSDNALCILHENIKDSLYCRLNSEDFQEWTRFTQEDLDAANQDNVVEEISISNMMMNKFDSEIFMDGGAYFTTSHFLNSSAQFDESQPNINVSDDVDVEGEEAGQQSETGENKMSSFFEYNEESRLHFESFFHDQDEDEEISFSNKEAAVSSIDLHHTSDNAIILSDKFMDQNGEEVGDGERSSDSLLPDPKSSWVDFTSFNPIYSSSFDSDTNSIPNLSNEENGHSSFSEMKEGAGECLQLENTDTFVNQRLSEKEEQVSAEKA